MTKHSNDLQTRRSDEMDYEEVIRRRRMELFNESQKAQEKFRVALREARRLKAAWHEIRAQVMELHHLSHAMSEAERQEAESEVGARVSEMLRYYLTKARDGMTLGQLADLMARDGVKRSTISSALHNMKKRGEIVHTESTGQYRLPGQRVTAPSDSAILHGLVHGDAAKPR
jgi:hypothetical protein